MKKCLKMLLVTLLFTSMGVAIAADETPQQGDLTPSAQTASANDEADCSDN